MGVDGRSIFDIPGQINVYIGESHSEPVVSHVRHCEFGHSPILTEVLGSLGAWLHT